MGADAAWYAWAAVGRHRTSKSSPQRSPGTHTRLHAATVSCDPLWPENTT